MMSTKGSFRTKRVLSMWLGVMALSVVTSAGNPDALAQCAPEWELRAQGGPRPRVHHVMAFDSDRGLTFMHGGRAGFPNEDDIWAWDGSAWSQWPGYLDRVNHAMVYDKTRKLLIAFGGFRSGALEPEPDTWAYDGERWSRLHTGGPAARWFHAMAYDSARDVTVLFGGNLVSNVVGDTWELDATGWRRVATGGPSPRSGHVMAFDSDRGVTVLCGGGPDPDGETWEWNGAEWALVSTAGPAPASGARVAYDSNRQRTILTGATDPEATWEWDGERWSRVSIGGPSDRAAHAMAFDSWRSKVVLFGGQSAQYLNDTWEYGLPNPFLLVNATCPAGGAISIRWTCATPDRTAALVFSRARGTFTIPKNHPCAGTALDLSPTGIRLVWTGRTGHDGSGVIRTQAGPSACGSYLQFIDVGSCRVSAAVRIN